MASQSPDVFKSKTDVETMEEIQKERKNRGYIYNSFSRINSREYF
jgi:hypothetical protein